MNAKGRNGSVQIIEFSYLFPLVLLTVVALVYVSVALFFYGYAFALTEEAVEDDWNALLKNERIYWQISDQSVDESQEAVVRETLETRLQRMEVLPGMSFSVTLQEEEGGSAVRARANCVYFGKELFSVTSKKDLFKPTEFAMNTDLVCSLAESTGLLETIKDRFGSYLNKDLTYEVF